MVLLKKLLKNKNKKQLWWKIVLVSIKRLDAAPLELEVRTGGTHGEIITFYNESDNSYSLVIDSVEYSDVFHVWIIFKGNEYYDYIQYGESPNVVKLNILKLKI